MLREGSSAFVCGFLRERIEGGLVGCESRPVLGRVETEQEPVGGHRHAAGIAVRLGKERQQGGGRTPRAIDARAKRSGCEAELVSRVGAKDLCLIPCEGWHRDDPEAEQWRGCPFQEVELAQNSLQSL